MDMKFLQIEPTNLCNLNCVMCSRRNLKRHGTMSLRGLKHIIEQIPGVRAVRLQGLGEPMLNKEILSMMQYLRSSQIRVYTSINGTILPCKPVEFLDSVNRIDFSIDTLNPDEFMIIRGSDRVKEIVENFKILCAGRKTRHKPQIYVNFTMVNASRKRIEEIFRLVRQTGANGINFNLLQNWMMTEPGKRNQNDDGSYSQIADSIIRMSRKWHVRAKIQKYVYGYSKCKWAVSGCYITWDGYVTPCSQRPDPDEINFGNIFETDFAKIYNSERYVEFRCLLMNGISTGVCENCSLYKQDRSRRNNNSLSPAIAFSF